jgi:hypothetical protein
LYKQNNFAITPGLDSEKHAESVTSGCAIGLWKGAHNRAMQIVAIGQIALHIFVPLIEN